MSVSGGGAWTRPASDPHPGGNMPEWKLRVLERKRAKMASVPAVALSWGRGREVSPHRRRVEHGRKRSPAGSPVRQPGRNKGSPAREEEDGSGERLVLQDSLGPLHDNPFIKLEKERRRRRPQHPHSGAATPIRHLLDLYSNVPGIRTIRAENIIIIESDPGYFGGGTEGPSCHSDPMEELLAKRGSKVAEIRAAEVVIYERDPSITAPATLEKGHSEVLEEAGRVSRLMEKFDHGHTKPVRTKSWENMLERDSQPPAAQKSKSHVLPKPSTAERHSQAPLNQTSRRSGDISPSSMLDEDGKRFPLNNPSWLPSKHPAILSLPDPGLFHKRPSSPLSLSGPVTPLSPSSPLQSFHYDSSTEDKLGSPVVATFRERFENSSTHNDLSQSKPSNVSQKIGNNTMVINPKAISNTKVKSSDPHCDLSIGCPPLTNGHVDYSKVDTKSSGSIKIQDLLSKSKRKGGTSVQTASEERRQVPSTASVSINEISKETYTWRPKLEVDHVNSKIPYKYCATQSETPSYNHCERGLTSATPSQQKKVSASTSNNDSFEIRPAPKPDLQSIPDNDIQAKALANIRMQSKNSFVFIPKKRQAPSIPKPGNQGERTTINKPKVKDCASVSNGHEVQHTESPEKNVIQSNGRPFETHQGDTIDSVERTQQMGNYVTERASPVPALTDFHWKSDLLPHSSTESHSFTDIGAELEYFSSIQEEEEIPVTKIHGEDLLKPDIPVTNIDDIVNSEDRDINNEAKPASKGTDSSMPSYRPHAALSSVRFKGGNTFTVVPKRKPVVEREALRSGGTADQDDEEYEEARSKSKSSNGMEAPYSELGALLKKRYPTAEEIQVIGGYQSLSKSCLSKIGSTRKKVYPTTLPNTP
ncbi:hypothetical protein FKM82_005294 [Ascaphus truei]